MLKAFVPCLVALTALAGAPAQATPTQCFAAGLRTSGPDVRLDEPKYVFMTSVFESAESMETLSAWFVQDIEAALERRPAAEDFPQLRQFGCWLVGRQTRVLALQALHWRDGPRATYTYDVGWEPVRRQVGPLRWPTFRPPPDDLPPAPFGAPPPKVVIPEVIHADAPAGQRALAALGVGP
jgi:hypothetical protein